MDIKRIILVTAASALALAGIPQAASAAPSEVTVYTYNGGPDQDNTGIIDVSPAGGDRDAHHITAAPAGDGTTYILSDTEGIGLAPAPGFEQAEKCVVIDAHSVRCAPPDPSGNYSDWYVELNGGPGNDVIDGRALADPASVSLWGGGGNDRLLGSAADDFLHGGEGRDVLIGYAGRDAMDGHRGPDTIRARDGEIDDITCGQGKARKEKAIRDRSDRGYKRWYTLDDWDREPISC